jgi:hypothetical protein
MVVTVGAGAECLLMRYCGGHWWDGTLDRVSDSGRGRKEKAARTRVFPEGMEMAEDGGWVLV